MQEKNKQNKEYYKEIVKIAPGVFKCKIGFIENNKKQDIFMGTIRVSEKEKKRLKNNQKIKKYEKRNNTLRNL